MKQNENTPPQEFLSYLPALTKQPDFDSFWTHVKNDRHLTSDCGTKPMDIPLRSIDAKHIWFTSYDGTILSGWLSVPTTFSAPYPCIIRFHGYGGHKGYPHEFLPWNDLGYAVLSMDIRGQNGSSGDGVGYRTGSSMSPMCQGILDKDEYYLKHLYLDALGCVEIAASLPKIDNTKLIVAGGSQGGALATAAAALDKRIYACICDVPSNSDIIQRVIGGYGSFGAVRDYLKSNPVYYNRVFEVLSYFDTMNLAEQISCPVYASVGLADTVCPAKCFFATYNRITAPKEISIYPFAGHEGGGTIRSWEKLWILRSLLG